MRTPTMLLFSSVLTLASGIAGCGAHPTGPGDALETQSASLVSDNEQTVEAEQDLELTVEQPLSGSASESASVDTTSDASAAGAAIANAGLYFQPSGCLKSTRVANVITHVFDDCTGPHGRAHISGTVTSTWTAIANGVQVVHAADDFRVNGAVVDHHATLSYSYEDGTYKLQRVATTSGVTAQGAPIEHEAAYTTTWQPQGLCATRNGSSQTTIDGREFSRTIDGYERCGVGLLGCPKAGTFTLERPNLEVAIQFREAGLYDLTVNGRTYANRRIAWCVVSDS